MHHDRTELASSRCSTVSLWCIQHSVIELAVPQCTWTACGTTLSPASAFDDHDTGNCLTTVLRIILVLWFDFHGTKPISFQRVDILIIVRSELNHRSGCFESSPEYPVHWSRLSWNHCSSKTLSPRPETRQLISWMKLFRTPIKTDLKWTSQAEMD